MSEPIDPKSPQPTTRREVLEGGHREKGVWGPEIHANATEPMPNIQESNYLDVLVRPMPMQGVEFKNRGLVIGVLTMTAVSLITFYIPFLNALLGGVFGGFFAKRWGRAFKAAAIASVAVPATLAFFYGFDTPDLLYFMYGLGFWGWTALHVAGMFIGAAAGVYSRPLADRRGLSRGIMEG
jgi:hypothetical protein